jgi:hypothetical protein
VSLLHEIRVICGLPRRCGVVCEVALQLPGRGKTLPSASAVFYAVVFTFDPIDPIPNRFRVDGGGDLLIYL